MMISAKHLILALLLRIGSAFTTVSIGNQNYFGFMSKKTLVVRNIPPNRPSIRFRAKDNSDDWGASEEAEAPSGVDMVPKDSLSKEKELELLRSQMATKYSPSSEENDGMPSNKSIKGERDLFIPIFSTVSLVGLFAAYGYEMLRLYSRGELYLPGM